MSLQGTLRTLGIAEVLEFLAGRSATGRLEITADTGHATYWVSSGQIASVDYSFAREAGTDAAEATYYALAEVEGTFHFDEDQRPEDVDETEAISDVLARTADTADGWSYVEEVIPTPQHWLSRSETLEDTVAVQPDWWVAIAAIADGITPQKLAHALDTRALATSTMASEMVRAGLLQVDEPRADAPEAAPAAEHGEGDAETTESEVHPEGLNLFGGGSHSGESVPNEPEADASAELDELVSELESQSPADTDAASAEPAYEAHEEHEDEAPVPLSVVEPIDEQAYPGADEAAVVAEAFGEAPFGGHTFDAPPAPAGAPDAVSAENVAEPDPIEAPPASPALVWDAQDAPEETPFDAAAPTGVQTADSADDWGDDGWASDHSQPAAVSLATAEEYQDVPAAADVFGAAPAVDPATMPPAPGPGEGGSGEDTDEYATDDRSSVLKFLRRD